MSFRNVVFVAAGGSLALLAGAFAFQLLGYAPCRMCIWQRWPHAAAVAIGILAILFPDRRIAAAGCLAALIAAALGAYHAGVERGWWEGLAECAGGAGLTGLSGEDLLDPTRDAGPPPVRCDEPVWALFGVSLAGWNALFSLALAGLWILSALRAPLAIAEGRKG